MRYITSKIPLVLGYQTGIFIVDSLHSSTSCDTKRSKENYSGEQWHLWQNRVSNGCLMSTDISIGRSLLENFDSFSRKTWSEVSWSGLQWNESEIGYFLHVLVDCDELHIYAWIDDNLSLTRIRFLHFDTVNNQDSFDVNW